MVRDRLIAWVAGVQLVGSVVTGFLPNVQVDFTTQLFLTIPHIALNFSLTCVIALWAVFSQVAWWKRVSALAAGGAYLQSALLFSEVWSDPYHQQIILLGGLSSLLSILRFKAHLVRLPQQSTRRSPYDDRLSLRTGMLLTGIVALIAACARIAGKARLIQLLTLPSLWIGCDIVVGAAAIWAALVARNVRAQGLLVLSAALGLGVLRAYSVDVPMWHFVFFYMVAMSFCQAALAFGWMYVLRTYRYRISFGSDADIVSDS